MSDTSNANVHSAQADLYAALAKAQGVMGAAVKGRQNPFFKSRYATLADCWNVCREPLSENGLSVIQLVTATTSAGVTLKTILAHSGGGCIESDFMMPIVKNDPQGVGSAISYARRYALSAMVGIVSDEDDDGNAASGKRTDQPRHVSTSAGSSKINAAVSAPPPKTLIEATAPSKQTEDRRAREITSMRRDIDGFVGAGGKPDLLLAADAMKISVSGRKPSQWTDEEVTMIWEACPALNPDHPDNRKKPEPATADAMPDSDVPF